MNLLDPQHEVNAGQEWIMGLGVFGDQWFALKEVEQSKSVEKILHC